MAEQLPPDWAIERALVLCGSSYEDAAECRAYASMGNTVSKTFMSFARYIEEHEEAPVDPLLIEAREICAVDAERNRLGIAEQYRAGTMDNVPLMELTIQGLRRGIEIGKAQA